jgi:predicted transcriptional regulator
MDTNVQERAHVNAFVDATVRRELERLAQANDRSLSAEIRRALAAHVERAAHLEKGEG